ncbi:MAG: metal ABC transporter ATP-binding protein [Defluviitaleaceae bacterium]|nr:metal ABC transporter ATP-binding protein [Defluviitaleaceae bacterium]
MALISCRDAAFAYDGKTVVEGLNFRVAQGDYLCIVGENGSGKSTLMKGLLGLMRPKSGEISTGDGLKSTQIGYLPQQSSQQKDFPASVYEVVISGTLNRRGIRPFYSWREHEVAEENMEKLGIIPLRKKSFRELSGGQQQRVLLARALCATEKLLLLDEPVSGLDPIVTAELYQTIDTLRRETGVAIIMISHDIRSGVEYAPHILHLQNRQIFFGTTDEYKNSEAGRYFLQGGEFR